MISELGHCHSPPAPEGRATQPTHPLGRAAGRTPGRHTHHGKWRTQPNPTPERTLSTRPLRQPYCL